MLICLDLRRKLSTSILLGCYRFVKFLDFGKFYSFYLADFISVHNIRGPQEQQPTAYKIRFIAGSSSNLVPDRQDVVTKINFWNGSNAIPLQFVFLKL